MAEFNTNCPHCGAELVADEAWIGMEVECPTCNKSFTVAKETPVEKPSVPTLNLSKLTPQKEETALPTLTPLAPTAPAEIKLSPIGNTSEATETEENSFVFVCPACGTQVELPAIMKGKKYECKACAEESIAEATTEKKCPFCGEMIKIHATVCKHCKKDVTNAPINMPPPKEETFPYFCPECDTFVELPVSMDGKEYECKSCCETNIAKPATERKCPACGEMIKIKATICKHCKKSVPPLMVNNTINLQPIGNSAINLQQIQPIQSNGVSLQPVGNTSINLQPIQSTILESTEGIKTFWGNNAELIKMICWGGSIIGYLVGLILLFFSPSVGIIIIVIAVLLSVVAVLNSNSEKFELEEGEQLISTCRLRDMDSINYYTRITNTRVVLSAIEYPLLPVFITMFIEIFAKPTAITYSWEIADISKIELRKETVFTYMFVSVNDEEFKFAKNKSLVAWWENQRKGI